MIVKLLQSNRGKPSDKEVAIYVISDVKSYTLVENINKGSILILRTDENESTYCGGVFDKAYVMNDEGKTIDTIILVRPEEQQA